MLTATVKFTLETRKLTKEQNTKNVEQRDSNINIPSREKENSDNKENSIIV